MSYEGQDDFIALSLNSKPLSEPIPGEPSHGSAPEERKRNVVSSGMLAVGYLAGLVAVLTGLLTGLAFHTIHGRLTQWPRVEASVDSCENYDMQAWHGGDPSYWSFEYGFRCNLTYTPQSLVHHSLVDIGYRSSNPDEMAAWATHIQRGDQIPVIVDPNDFSRVRFATDFQTSYAPALHNLHFVVSTTLVSLAMIAFGRMLRPDPVG